MSNINWSYFPKTDPIPDDLNEVINVFQKNSKKIDTIEDEEKIKKGIKVTDERLQSDDILKILEKDFQDLNFKIEIDKKQSNKIRIPVLFGRKGRTAHAPVPVFPINKIINFLT